MIHKTDARRDLGGSIAVEIQAKADLGFVGAAVDDGLSGVSWEQLLECFEFIQHDGGSGRAECRPGGGGVVAGSHDAQG